MGKSEKPEILVVTTPEIPGREITTVLGLVYGSSVRSRTIGGNILGQMRAILGGKQKGYIKLINQARDEALEDLRDTASEMGANAVVMMRFDSGQFDSDDNNKGAMQETTAYGTAVVVADQSMESTGISSKSAGGSETGAGVEEEG